MLVNKEEDSIMQDENKDLEQDKKQIEVDEEDPLVMWMHFLNGNKQKIEEYAKKNEDIKYAYEVLKEVSKDENMRKQYEERIASMKKENK